MIKFKDFLRVIDLEEQKLNVVVDSNLRSLSINDYLNYKNFVVGFVCADNNDMVVRLYKGVENE